MEPELSRTVKSGKTTGGMISGNPQHEPGSCWTEPFLLNRATKQRVPFARSYTSWEYHFECSSAARNLFYFFFKLFSASPSNQPRRSAMHQSFPITFGTCRQLSTNLWQQPVNLCWMGVVLGVGFSLYLLLFLHIVGLQQHLLSGPRQS